MIILDNRLTNGGLLGSSPFSFPILSSKHIICGTEGRVSGFVLKTFPEKYNLYQYYHTDGYKYSKFVVCILH